MLKILFTASVLFNLLFIGGLIGYSFRPDHPISFPPYGGWMLRHLDKDRRHALSPIVRRQAQKIRPLRGKLRKARRRLEASLLSEPIKQTELAAATAELQRLSVQMQTEMHQQLILIMSALPLSDRKQALKFVRQYHRHGRREGRPPRAG